MDKPTTSAGPNAPNSSAPEDSGSERDFGATGVFGVVKAPEPVEELALGSGAGPDAKGNRAPEAAKPQPVPQPVPAPKAFAEPVVHRVEFGGGAAESSPDLLDRLRMASAGRAPIAEKPPLPGQDGKGSAGFTQLLRTLGSDASVPTAEQAPEMPRPAQDSGFTSLLRTLNSQEAEATPSEDPTKTAQPAFQSIPEEPRKAPAVPAPGGFTELLRAAPAEGPEIGGPQAQAPGQGDAPAAGAAPLENKPGEFTQLFGTFDGAETSPPSPASIDRGAGELSRGSEVSFTRMLSLEQQSTPAEPAYREERKPSARSLDFELTPQTARPAEASRDPFSPSPLPDAQTFQSRPPAGGPGITRLIRMLDEPSNAPAPRVEVAPVSPPGGTEPGVWTRTFASLATPSEPPAPAAKAPDLTPTQAPVAPAVTPPPTASVASGPSEFTRILDASRMRELAMKGEQVPAAENAVAARPPQGSAPTSPPVPFPSYPISAPPAVYPPAVPQVPAYPMIYKSPAGSIPAAGGSVPQPPGMYVPAPPIPIAPQAPPVKAAEPGMGKTQQYLLVMGVVIIVLLVAILVTVVFLMKH
ncbi:MAG: hypothetical protein ABSF16_03290 [Terracidiphilus sp.]|jgi:hypothetical protein